MKLSTDYHDYVFKNGEYIGKFEEMYKFSKEIPWHQNKIADEVFSNIDIAILKQFKYNSVCEVGCGLGYFTNRLYKELRAKRKDEPPYITGMDISEVAIAKARSLFPKIRFIRGNLLEEKPLSGEYFDLVVVKEVLWYVCHKLDRFLQNSKSLVRSGGFFYVSQSFPVLERQFVGKEILPNPDALLQFVKRGFRVISLDLFYRVNHPDEGPYFHFLGQKK